MIFLLWVLYYINAQKVNLIPQVHCMNDLRQAIIDSLDSCATDNTDIREIVQNLVENEGEETYPILLNVLTHLEFSTQDAKLN